MSDEVTLARARRGDPAAFEALVTPHEQTIWRLCYQMMGNREDAADALQETMLRAWQAIGTYRGEASVGSWLYRIGVSACLDALRRRKARPAESLDALHEGGFDPPAGQPSPEEETLRRDRNARVRAALSSLPEEQRVPLVLSAVEGQPYEEIAAALSLPVGTVKSRISRARLRLKEILSGDGNNSVSAASNQVKGGRVHDL